MKPQRTEKRTSANTYIHIRHPTGGWRGTSTVTATALATVSSSGSRTRARTRLEAFPIQKSPLIR
jgi:hypothetical protein